MLKVFTIGHSTREFDDVMAMLHSNEVGELVDVRSYPSSRKFPHWNREQIEAACPPEITYRWVPELGGRRHTPAGTPTVNNGWRVKAFRDYADYMATDDFQSGLDALLAIAKQAPPAIMCSEAVPWRCHRRLISDALIVRGVAVFNIMSKTSTRPASMTPFAQVTSGQLTYPAGEQAS